MKRKFDINNPDQSNWFFLIRKIDIKHQDYDESLPHQHKFHQFLFFEKGSGTHLIDDKTYEVKDKSIHFVSPNHIHDLKVDAGTKGYVCMFKEELFFINNESEKFLNEVDLFSNWNTNPLLELGDTAFGDLKSIIESIVIEYENQKTRKNEVLLMFLKLFLIKASRLCANCTNVEISSKRKIVESFLGLVDESCNKNLPINYYAEQLSITTTYLNRLVNDVYDKSVSDFVNDRIVLESKRILRFSSKSIKEVSFELGFEDPSYFSRFFKKHTKLTPVEYRNESSVSRKS
ncbi:MAG: hypothetical protein COB15_15625 [Flavobacteriales bacterium]|nr:MAG: hypothetical protein COB15_15625 [Flavobacteriales bacterium]